MGDETEKLQKVIARAGVASRRHAEILIRQGRVTVDGTVAHTGMRVDASTSEVSVDGALIPVNPDLVYYVLNKPTGVICSAADTHGRDTVIEMVPTEPRVFPVGRLDQDSEGLLLLTNDGRLAEALTHPRYQVPKVYNVLLEGSATNQTMARFTDGIELEDGLARAQSARILGSEPGRTLVELVLTEGRNREIRRMADTLGFPVVSLFRTAIGPIRDQGLRSGQWRSLTTKEVTSLYETVHD